jgi:predicted dehydrogenase
MTTDSASSSQLISACKANNVRLGVGYHLRWHQGHRLLRQAIGEGKLGQIRHMDIQWTYNSPPSDWRVSAVMGKWWSLAAVGTHAIDLVVWLLGPTCGAVVDQRSIVSSPVHGGPHDETAVVSLRFASGATAQVVSSVIFKAPRTAHIYGTAAGAVLEGTFGPYGAGKITVAGEDLDFAQSNPYVGELTDFVRAIKAGSEPEADGACGLFNVQLLESAVGHEPMGTVSETVISKGQK